MEEQDTMQEDSFLDLTSNDNTGMIGLPVMDLRSLELDINF